MNDPNWTNIVTAIGAVATALLTAGALYMACRAWGTAKRALTAAQQSAQAARDANEQARRDSIARTRPYVYAEVVPGLGGMECFDLKITNAGQSSAIDLTLSFDTWPDEPDDIADAVRGLLSTPRTLPPGCSIRAMWRIQGELTGGQAEAGMGVRGTLSPSYTSLDPSRPRYTDDFDVLIEESGYWPVGESGPTPGDLKGDQLKFYKLGQALVRRVSELTR